MNSAAFFRSIFFALSFGVSCSAFGQVAVTPTKDVSDKGASDSFSIAIRVRTELTATLVSGEVAPEDGLNELRGTQSPMGLGLEGDAEFALAAIDIGQRLLAKHKTEGAFLFFREAEIALGKAIDNAPRDAAAQKAMYLQNRAFIRNRFLNKTPEADSDLAQAIALRPEDKFLQKLRDQIPGTKAGRQQQPSKG